MSTSIQNLSTTQLSQSVYSLALGDILLQTSYLNIEELANLNLPGEKSPPTYQVKVREQAQQAMNNATHISNSIHASLQNFAGELASFSPELIHLAEQYDQQKGDQKTVKTALSQGITALNKFIHESSKKQDAAIDQLQFIIQSLQQEAKAFQKTLEQIGDQIGPAAQSGLQNQIEGILNQIKDDNHTIAKGVVDDIMPIFNAIVAVLSTGQGQKGAVRNGEIVAASIKKVNDVSNDQQKAMDDVHQKIQQYTAVLSQLSGDEVNYAIACNYYIQVTMLATDLSNYATIALQLNLELANYSTSFKELGASISSDNRISNLSQVITAITTDWAQLNKEVSKLVPTGQIPVSTR